MMYTNIYIKENLMVSIRNKKQNKNVIFIFLIRKTINMNYTQIFLCKSAISHPKFILRLHIRYVHRTVPLMFPLNYADDIIITNMANITTDNSNLYFFSLGHL